MSRFRFLIPAPLPPTLIQTQLGKYFKQENNIVTLNQPYKRGNGWQMHFCLSFVESKSSEREWTQQVSVMIVSNKWTQSVVLSANMLLYDLFLWQKAAFPSKYKAWVYKLFASVQQLGKLLFSVSFAQQYQKKETVKTLDPGKRLLFPLMKEYNLFASNWATTLHC